MAVCPNCGENNPERAKFCSECATALHPGGSIREARRVVTILFCDIAGSTNIGERLDPESVRAVMGRYFSEMTAVIERHGGTVEKFIGDAIMAVFGIPRLHEDDALRAVRAATEMRQAVAALNETLQQERNVSIAVRTGVNTGEVVAGESSTRQSLVTGDAVNVAARLEQSAGANEIFIGQTTFRLVRDAVVAESVEPLTLKGKAASVPAWRVDEVTRGAPGSLRRGRSPLVGRKREERLLAETFERVLVENTCHLFTIFGSAGVGKSRLAREVTHTVQTKATVLRGSCLSYGERVSFRPVVEMISEAAGIASEDSAESAAARIESLVMSVESDALLVERLTTLVGLSDAGGTAEETFWAVRKLFEAIAARRPLVLFFDDLHWAEPALLDLIDQLAEWSRNASILILCAARPELLERRPSWGGGKLNTTSLLLSALTEEQSQALIDNLAGELTLSDDVRAKLISITAGQPLFIEEMLAMLAEEKAPAHDTFISGTQSSQLSIPETIHALLAARLDQLPADERRVLQVAAVVGPSFPKAAIADLLSDEPSGWLESRLSILTAKGLVREQPSRVTTGDTLLFRQTLLRDAAYNSIPKKLRAELHERIARWIEHEPVEAGVKADDVLADHLELAYRYRTELRPGDEHARTLGRQALGYLAAAGTRAVKAADATAATDLLTRAQSLMAKVDPGSFLEGTELAGVIGRAAIMLGEWGRAVDVLTPVVDRGPPAIARDLGVALCKLHRAYPRGPEYRRGQRYLEAATAASPKDADALASLAGTWKGVDESAAHRLYQRAVAADPSDPYALGNVLEYEIAARGDLSIVHESRSVIEAAIARCRAQADAGANLPWAFYDIGKFNVLLDRPYESLAAYAKAVHLSTAAFMIRTSLDSLDRLEVVGEKLPALAPASRFLVLATAAVFPDDPTTGSDKVIAAASGRIEGRVVVIVGGTGSEVEQGMTGYREALVAAFERYEGVIVSGGTAHGISRLAGDIAQHYPETVGTIGYIPESSPTDVTFDADPRRYGELRATDGPDFSFLEPLQYWIDIVASGIRPAKVKVVGIDGGVITATEYRMALGLGAWVGVISGSGRAADELLEDRDWITSPKLVPLAPGIQGVGAFVMS